MRSPPHAPFALPLIFFITERFPCYYEWPVGRQPIPKTKTHRVFEAEPVLWNPDQEDDHCTYQGRLQPLQAHEGY